MVTEQQQLRGLPWSLAAEMFNTVFCLWTFGGSVFLLFLSELGLPKGQIGAVLALFPFCGLLALGFAPAATRWGRKRVYLTCYGARKVVMASLLLLPWILETWGRTAGVVYLFAVISVFAVLRALAETALYPWFQEAIPNRVRGKFASWSTLLTMVASIGALLVAGRVLGDGAGLRRFEGLLGAGCVIGVIGVALRAKVPGGAPQITTPMGAAYWSNLVTAARDRNFIGFLTAAGLTTAGTLVMLCFLPLYVNEQLQLNPAAVVRLDAVLMVGGALSGMAWGWLADRVGSRPVLMIARTVSVLVPAGWLFLPRHGAVTGAGSVVLYFLQGVAANGAAIGAGRLLFNSVVPPAQNTAYMAIYYAWMGVTGGLAPLLAGGLLTATAGWLSWIGPVPLDGHTVLFALSLTLLAWGGWWFGQVKPDDVHTTRAVLARAVNMIWGWRLR